MDGLDAVVLGGMKAGEGALVLSALGCRAPRLLGRPSCSVRMRQYAAASRSSRREERDALLRPPCRQSEFCSPRSSSLRQRSRRTQSSSSPYANDKWKNEEGEANFEKQSWKFATTREIWRTKCINARAKREKDKCPRWCIRTEMSEKANQGSREGIESKC